MNSISRHGPRRSMAAAVALAFTLSACGSNPFVFSKHLDTFNPRAAQGELNVTARQPHEGARLVGDLDLALAALMDQRRLLWEAAGDAETMKNLTALGLLGLGAAGLYKEVAGNASRQWFAKAGLTGAVVYGGAQWLEPSARQKIYLRGAESLTCLALATAPYEMTVKEFKKATLALREARKHLEQVFSILRTIGDYRDSKHEEFIVSGAWAKARFADKVLTATEGVLGNIEQVGPRLRDMSALLAGRTGNEAADISRDLGKLPAALAALTVDANTVIGKTVFTLPEREGDTGKPENKDKTSTTPTDPLACPTEAKPPEPPANAASSPVTPPVLAASQTPASANAKKAKPKAPSAAESAASAAAAALEAKAAAERAERAAATAKEAEQALKKAAALAIDSAKWKRERFEALLNALKDLSEPLAASVSLVRRLETARDEQSLPEGCESNSPIRLLPADRSVRLLPGASFQFILLGDAAPVHSFLTAPPSSGALDVSYLNSGPSEKIIRLMAGREVKDETNTVLRITDSKARRTFTVDVKVCKSKTG